MTSRAVRGAATAESADPPFAGLSEQEAARRLSSYGPNDPAPTHRRSAVTAFLLLFVNPLAAILLIAAAFSAFLGQRIDAAIMVLMVVLGITVNFLQTYRSERAVELLRERVKSVASALRDGNWRELP